MLPSTTRTTTLRDGKKQFLARRPQTKITRGLQSKIQCRRHHHPLCRPRDIGPARSGHLAAGPAEWQDLPVLRLQGSVVEGVSSPNVRVIGHRQRGSPPGHRGRSTTRTFCFGPPLCARVERGHHVQPAGVYGTCTDTAAFGGHRGGG